MQLATPPDGQVYLGMSIRGGNTDADGARFGDRRPFSERVQDTVTNELGGKNLAFLRVWAGWQFPWDAGKPMAPFDTWLGDIAEAQGVTGPESLVLLDWTVTNTTAGNGGITVKDIASGGLDAYITQYARDVKLYGKPLLMRLFGGEMNGSWWWGQSPLANPDLTTADFVKAWRRVVDIFRHEDALNVSWAWNVNAGGGRWIDSNIAAYWPGDAYVDWAGADIYDGLPVSDLDAPYAFAVAHHKPFLLAEWGVRNHASTLTPPEQNTWLNQMFDYFESHPAIKAISYFNYNAQPDEGVPFDEAKRICLYDGKVCYQANTNDNDCRLLADSGAGWRQTFSRRVSTSRYLSTALFEPVPLAASVAKDGNGSGSVTSSPAGIGCGSTCSHVYSYGTRVTLTATPATGSRFTGWSGACTGTGTCTLAMTSARWVTATFNLLPETLTVTKSGSGSGTVSSSPSGIKCGSTCSHSFGYGTSVALTAVPTTGSTFRGWSGACTGIGTCTLAMTSAKSVTATFTAQPQRCIVPKVKGKKLAAAKRAITKAHCSVGKVTKVKSSTRNRGHVVSQSPKPGKHLTKGAKVALKVGK